MTTSTEFRAFLVSVDACEPALDWLGYRSAEQAWADCPRGDWLLWVVEHVVRDRELHVPLVDIAVGCARSMLSATTDQRVHDCVATVERWLADPGSVSMEELGEAARATWAAARAAEAARAAARAARAAAEAAEATWAAAWVIEALEIAEAATRQGQADLVRKHIPWSAIGPLIERAARSNA